MEIPFCLTKALAGARVFTRFGIEVSPFAHFPNLDSEYRFIGVVSGQLKAWTIKGEYDVHEPTDLDLHVIDSP